MHSKCLNLYPSESDSLNITQRNFFPQCTLVNLEILACSRYENKLRIGLRGTFIPYPLRFMKYQGIDIRKRVMRDCFCTSEHLCECSSNGQDSTPDLQMTSPNCL